MTLAQGLKLAIVDVEILNSLFKNYENYAQWLFEVEEYEFSTCDNATGEPIFKVKLKCIK